MVDIDTTEAWIEWLRGNRKKAETLTLETSMRAEKLSYRLGVRAAQEMLATLDKEESDVSCWNDLVAP